MPRLLLRNGGDAGERLPVGTFEERKIADHVQLGVTGQMELRLDRHTAYAVERNAERPGERRCGNARGPDHRARLEPAFTHRHAAPVHRGDERVLPHLDPQPLERPPRRVAEILREGREDARPPLDQHDTRLLRRNRPELVGERVTRDFGDGAGHLDAGRARRR